MNLLPFRVSDSDFHILETTGRVQTATMTLQPGEATADNPEAHPHSDQVVFLLEGELIAEVGEERGPLKAGESLIVPAGVKHRFSNGGTDRAFALTVYGPPAYETGDPH